MSGWFWLMMLAGLPLGLLVQRCIPRRWRVGALIALMLLPLVAYLGFTVTNLPRNEHDWVWWAAGLAMLMPLFGLWSLFALLGFDLSRRTSWEYRENRFRYVAVLPISPCHGPSPSR
jgi:hypothetical protein